MKDQNSILIIDHHPELYSALCVLFQRYGYTCSIVENGLSALRSLRSGQFELIILEINLPDVNGICLISMLKRLSPDTAVLVLSDDNTLESLFAALRLDVCGYLFKPVNPGQVLFCARETFKEQYLERRKMYGFQKKAPRRAKLRRSWQREVEEVYQVEVISPGDDGTASR